MPIKEIRQYSDWCTQGNHTIANRKEMLVNHRKQISKKIDELKDNLTLIDNKIATYKDPDKTYKIDDLVDKI